MFTGICYSLSLLAVSLNPAMLGGGRTIYVSASAEGVNDGSGWTDAHTDLQVAIGAAASGDVIWVAAGSYKPGARRSSSFTLRDGVEIYGGFAGDEDPASFDLSTRDFSVNETVLDGRLIGGELTYHVVTAIDVDDSAILDGFTITGGRADGITINKQDVGGGALIVDASPMLRHCRFIDNEAGTRGGAVHVGSASPIFVYCTFVSNRTTVSQGENNFGGALFATGSTSTFASPTLLNSLFVGNSAGVGNGGSGGAMYATATALLTVVNCTVAHNFADSAAGGIFGSPTVVGSVIWGNFDRLGRGRSSQISGSAVVSYSCLEGGWNGIGNTGEDPRFSDPKGPDKTAGTADDNFRLLAGSPCIDAGNNESLIAALSTDLDGAPRFIDDPVTDDRGVAGAFDAVVDMGAFEYQAECNNAQDCNDGLNCNGLEGCDAGRCVPGIRADCDDSIECTVDACVEDDGSCRHTPADALCDNGSYCDGKEVCDAVRGCLAGSAILCADAFECTTDRCDEDIDDCVFDPVDESCDNGDACDGEERCIVGQGCVSTGEIECDDEVDCTFDSCDPSTDNCVHDPIHSFCDDGSFCNGSETCGGSGCLPGESPCGKGTFCDEESDRCVDCLTAEHCDDQDPCTTDTCDSGVCAHAEVADCCQTADDCPAGGICTTPRCDRNLCSEMPAEDGTTCSDDLFCNGEEVCTLGECVPGSPPCGETETCDEGTASCVPPPDPDCVTNSDCDDGNSCTDNTCENGNCVIVNNNAPCDDGDDCTSGDVCSEGTCVGETIPDCGDTTPPPPPPPADTDGDGVPDSSDLCPNTATGDSVDDGGCPVDPPPGQTVIDEDDDDSALPDPIQDPNLDTTADPATDGGEAGQSVPDDDPTLDEELMDAMDGPAFSRSACGACGSLGFISTFLLCLGLVVTKLIARKGGAG